MEEIIDLGIMSFKAFNNRDGTENTMIKREVS